VSDDVGTGSSQGNSGVATARAVVTDMLVPDR
jgi:hypothetical protein